jgi:hypothetical protein
VTVCGHNHRIDTPEGTRLADCTPAWDEASGHLAAVMTTGDDVGRRGSTDLMGSPALMDTASTNTFLGLAQALGLSPEELDDVLAQAHHTSDGDASPLDGITYIQGNAQFTNATGSGLLYITGDCDIAGGFSWVGLIYILGDLRLTGSAWILGGVMVEGDSQVAVDFGAGSPAVLYSRAALMQALTSAMPFVQLAWKEL